jgi:hypothetical protein
VDADSATTVKRGHGESSSVMHDDLTRLMETLGIPTHARPYSPHDVMVNEVIPAVRRLVDLVDGLRDGSACRCECPFCVEADAHPVHDEQASR